jgi:hypothetical protein
MYRMCWFNVTVLKNSSDQPYYDNKTQQCYLRMTFDADPDDIATITNTFWIVRRNIMKKNVLKKAT